ncbi:hypothetical protein F5884DRAFT_754016 [Xylogone sp. PMI_703]|nr:hypothetical protein F5884DRAFT_754016 [Xylogone sp. PMI_703]
MPNSQESHGLKHKIIPARSSKTCAYCDRSFAGREHLLRHERTHTQERPFACPKCQQRFQRQDAQARHTTRFCANASSVFPSSTKRRKTRSACDACHYKKQKCNGYQPCSSCAARSVTCTYTRDGLIEEASKDTPGTEISATNTNVEISKNEQPKDHTPTPHTVLLMASEDALHTLQQSPRHLSQTAVSYELSTRSSFEPPELESNNAPTGTDTLSQSIDTFLETQTANIMQNVGAGESGDQDNLAESWSGSVYPDPYPFLLYDTLSYEDCLSHSPLLNNHFSYGLKETLDPTSITDPAVSITLARLHTQINSHPASEQLIQWLKYVPALNHYSKPMLNSFLSYFAANVTPTFPVFKGFRVKQNTLPELTLAMAGVGGLFCRVPGNFVVARAMYNGAHRMLATRMYSNQDFSQNNQEFKLGLVQAYILFELFGLFGGDKRNYEYCQAFHMQMIQIIHEYQLLSPISTGKAEDDSSRQRLVDAVRMVECYRVILLQHPPELYLLGSEELGSESDGATNGDGARLFTRIMDLMTPDSPVVPITCQDAGRSALSALAALSWQAICTSSRSSQSGRIWPPEMFDLALNRWVQAHHIPIDDATMILFHTISIVMRTNMTHIHQARVAPPAHYASF